MALLLTALATACGAGPSPTASAATVMPTEPPPTLTAVPTSTLLLPLSHLALGMRLRDVEFAAALAREGDLFATGYQRNLARSERALSSVPESERMFMFATVDDMEQTLDQLDIKIGYVGYDLERWPATSEAEQQDPVRAVQKAQQIAHARGLKLVLGPSQYFVERYGTQLAPYVDVYVPQAKAYQANLSLPEYRETLRKLFADLRQANPYVKVFLDISPSPKAIGKTPTEMLESVQAVGDLIDGVWITYNQAEQEQVQVFVKLMGR
jgi:hypothetical protein